MHVANQREGEPWLWELLPQSPLLWQADKGGTQFSRASRALKRSLNAGCVPQTTFTS